MGVTEVSSARAALSDIIRRRGAALVCMRIKIPDARAPLGYWNREARVTLH